MKWDYPELGWTLNPMKSIPKRDRKDTDRWPCEDVGRDWSYAATNQGTQISPPEAGTGKEGFFPKAFRENMALPTP